MTVEQCSTVIATVKDREWTQAYIGHYRSDELIDKRFDLDERDVEVLRIPLEFEQMCPSFRISAIDASKQLYGLEGTNMSDFVVSRYSPGSHIRAHTDTGVSSTTRLVTCVQYFNEGYQGGEIEFPQFDVRHRPASGELLMFYSEYAHSVRQIVSGIRYSMVSFICSAAMFRLAL